MRKELQKSISLKYSDSSISLPLKRGRNIIYSDLMPELGDQESILFNLNKLGKEHLVLRTYNHFPVRVIYQTEDDGGSREINLHKQGVMTLNVSEGLRIMPLDSKSFFYFEDCEITVEVPEDVPMVEVCPEEVKEEIPIELVITSLSHEWHGSKEFEKNQTACTNEAVLSVNERMGMENYDLNKIFDNGIESILAENEIEIARNMSDLENLENEIIQQIETEKNKFKSESEDNYEVCNYDKDSQIDEKIADELNTREQEDYQVSKHATKKNIIAIDSNEMILLPKLNGTDDKNDMEQDLSPLHVSKSNIFDNETAKKPVINENKENYTTSSVRVLSKRSNDDIVLGVKRTRGDVAKQQGLDYQANIIINKSILVQKCSICLDEIVEKSRLDKCEHEFCRECIDKWAEFSNTCPLCVEEFKKIIYWQDSKQQIKRVKKRKFKYEEEDVDPWYENCAENCMVCNKNNDSHLLLVCDKCTYNICHTYCAGLDMIPDEDWLCSACVGVNTRRKAMYLKASQESNNIQLKTNNLRPSQESNNIQLKTNNLRSSKESNNIPFKTNNLRASQESNNIQLKTNSLKLSKEPNNLPLSLRKNVSRLSNSNSNTPIPAPGGSNIQTRRSSVVQTWRRKGSIKLTRKVSTRRSLGLDLNNVELQLPRRKTKMKYSLRSKRK
jgi:hypothetical protein